MSKIWLMSDSSISKYILPCGLKIIHKRCSGKVSCCGFVVKAGSRDEKQDELGMAHFTEHMIFKGTEKRNPSYILNRMEQVGGELNAYTTKEETFVYSVFLDRDFKRAVELLTDLFFNSNFKENEIKRERDVILDEISSYEDEPSDLIYDDFEEMIFPNHRIGRKILGEEKYLKKFNTEAFKSFHNRNYFFDNCVFFSQANIPFKKVLSIVEKFISMVTLKTIPCIKREPVLNLEHSINKVVDKKTTQSHVLIGNRAYSLHDKKRKGLFLLSNILAGPGMNSILNVALRENKGLVYSVESNVTTYSDTGLFSIYFGSSKENRDQCIDIINKELGNLRSKKISGAKLSAAKRQLAGQMLISDENKESNTLGMGKSLLYFDDYSSIEEAIEKINKITSEELFEIANEIFNPNTLCSLIYK